MRVRSQLAAAFLLAFCSSAAAFQAASAAEAHRPAPLPDRVILNWTANPSTGFSVTWRTDTTVSSACAEIVESEDGPDFVKKARRVNAATERYDTDLGPAHGHSVTFQNLKPATQYLYRAGDGKNWSEWNQTRTASAGGEPLTFLYVGDAQTNIYSMWSRVIRQAYSMAPEALFIVHAGDLINRNDRDQEWGEWHQAAGWINRLMPSFPAPGNHEYGKTASGERRVSVNWRPQYTLPLNGAAGLDETCYYMDVQGLRMIALNSNEKQKEQAAWLDGLLAKNPMQWTVLVFHHPIYSTARGRDNKALRELWQPVFDKHGVDLVLQGHDHTYGRTNLTTGLSGRAGKAGTVYVVSVSGPKMYDLDGKHPFQRVAEDTQLFQVIQIQGDTLRFESRTARGALYDAFELRKRAGKPNELVNRVPPTAPRLRKPATAAAR